MNDAELWLSKQREEYWRKQEQKLEITNVESFLEAVNLISHYTSGHRYIWRGVGDSSWGLHSSLVRRYLTGPSAGGKRENDIPREEQLQALERDFFQEAKDWKLDWHPGSGRLNALEMLAAMQHFGSPTRMIDFTHDPLVALWFAVREGNQGDKDGRIFAVDVYDREVPTDLALQMNEPWWWSPDGSPNHLEGWTKRVWVWTPPALNPRLDRQAACFLIGGVPGGTTADPSMRECMSVPLRLRQFANVRRKDLGLPARGRAPADLAFTIRIKKDQKAQIREQLEQSFDYSYRRLFPDFEGLSAYGPSRIEKRKCNAQNPRTCPFHGIPRVKARAQTVADLDPKDLRVAQLLYLFGLTQTETSFRMGPGRTRSLIQGQDRDLRRLLQIDAPSSVSNKQMVEIDDWTFRALPENPLSADGRKRALPSKLRQLESPTFDMRPETKQFVEAVESEITKTTSGKEKEFLDWYHDRVRHYLPFVIKDGLALVYWRANEIPGGLTEKNYRAQLDPTFNRSAQGLSTEVDGIDQELRFLLHEWVWWSAADWRMSAGLRRAVEDFRKLRDNPDEWAKWNSLLRRREARRRRDKAVD